MNFLLLLTILSLSLTVDCQSLTLGNIKITWQLGQSQTQFTVTSKLDPSLSLTNSWIGFGFNTAAQMNGANVIVCKSQSTSPSVENYYNSFYFSSPLSLSDFSVGLTNSSVSIMNDTILCSFTRDNSRNEINSYYKISNSTKYYIIAAYGPMSQIGNGIISKHSQQYVSASQIALSQTINIDSATTKAPSPIQSILNLFVKWFLSLFGK